MLSDIIPLPGAIDEGGLRLRREGDSRESVPVLLVLPRPRRRRQEDRALHGARLRFGGPPPDPPGNRGVRGPRECGARGTHGGVATRARQTVSVSRNQSRCIAVLR